MLSSLCHTHWQRLGKYIKLLLTSQENQVCEKEKEAAAAVAEVEPLH